MPVPASPLAERRGCDVVRAEIRARGWTYRRLADETGLTFSLVEAIVRGRLRISPTTARALARTFETTSDYWLELGA